MLLIPEAQTLNDNQLSEFSAMSLPSADVGRSLRQRRTMKQIEPGKITRCSLRSNPAQQYYLYVPRVIRQPDALFISVHGISRNAREHARYFATYAEQQGVVMLVPRFAREQTYGRHYQRLRVDETGASAAEVLNLIIRETERRLAMRSERLYLFGFSGGGQFVHRYLMAYPERVVSAALGAAGWYTFPDAGVRYPRGLRPNPKYRHSASAPAYLNIPVLVVVGEFDWLRDASLNLSERIDRQQGVNRVERGQRWIAAMQTAARAAGRDTTYKLQLLPDTGHDFSQAMTQGRAGDVVWPFLFGQ